ncbi:MAG TPA: ATP-dependent DNA helicase RecG [Candidatus Kapabacteria bacterium]|nr:ATP-dependent DNA helicase RecG [Candidatus Kapabacteria bacterium]
MAKRTGKKVETAAEDPSGAQTPVYPLQFVKGIGPARAAALAELGVFTLRDLFLFSPRAYLDRRTVLPLRQIRMLLAGEEGVPDQVTAIVTVKRLQVVEGGRGRKRLMIRVADATGEASLVFFHAVHFFIKSYQPDDVLAVSGAPELFGGMLQWTHPEMERLEQEEETLIHSGRIIPQYREGAKMKAVGLTSRSMRTVMDTLFRTYGSQELRESLPESLLKEYNLMPFAAAVRMLHYPESEILLDLARRRMKFEELFFFELGMAVRKEITFAQEPGIAFTTRSELAHRLVESLGFELTGAQKRVLHEIMQDMASPHAMNRLLQGDVGSGKTIVALLAMLVAAENGYQTAFMAPTEILAEQHTQTLKRLLDGLPVPVVQLVGGQKKRMREELLYEIRNNKAAIIVGTHALFQEEVEYANLGLVVIDEQHRFGVHQRAQLRNKGRRPDTLIMTATPIPRTLTMTLYGDLDVSVIDELPANRKPVRTAVRFESRIDAVWDFVRLEVREGRQVYIVYPLVEKSEKLELKSAVEHFEYLKSQVFPDLRLGLLHGQMFWYEKDDAMRDFLARKIDVLIATTVIEVGIDVPNASVMVVENAERFGLSQLHQLRGRVGRGNAQSYCILMTKDHYRYAMARGMSQNEARQERKAVIRRLQAMVETNDGFRISEIDLELRGPGDIVGTRQSGIPEFRHANLVTDGPIITQARKAAFAVVADDPELAKPEHAGIRDVFREATRRAMIYADVG